MYILANMKYLVVLVPFLNDFNTNWGTPIRIKGYTDGLERILPDFLFVAPSCPQYINKNLNYSPINIHRRWSKLFLLHNILYEKYPIIAKFLSLAIEKFSGIRNVEIFGNNEILIWAHQEQTVALYLNLTRAIPIVYDVHGLFDIQKEYREEMNLWRKLWFDMYMRHEQVIMRKADFINAVSFKMEEYITKRFMPLGKVFVAPDGIPDSVEEYSEIKPKDLSIVFSRKKRVILFAGSFKPIGGGRELVEEYMASNAIMDEYSLLLIGDGPDKGIIRDKINRMTNGEILIFSPVSHQELIAYMKGADVIVCPDIVNNEYNKMVPHIKLYDAVASGTSVVATDLPVNRALFPEGEGVFYFNFGDGSFEKAILKASSEQKRYDVCKLNKLTYKQRLIDYMANYKAQLGL